MWEKEGLALYNSPLENKNSCKSYKKGKQASLRKETIKLAMLLVMEHFDQN